MGHSEDYIRNKMYELEKEKVEVEKEKLTVLLEISESLVLTNGILIEQIHAYGIKHENEGDNKMIIESAKNLHRALNSMAEYMNKRWKQDGFKERGQRTHGCHDICSEQDGKGNHGEQLYQEVRRDS